MPLSSTRLVIRPAPRCAPAVRAFCRMAAVFLLVLLGTVCAPSEGAQAQTLPIPGLPGGLGGIGSPGTPAEPPADSAPTTPPEPETVAPDIDGQDPMQTLIDVLRDDAARERLLRELEAASSDLAPDPTPETSADPSGTDADDEEPVETFGDRTIDATRAIGRAIYVEMQNAWLRLQRVPNTVHLSTRIFEDGALVQSLREVLWPAFFLGSMLIGLRLLVRPLRRRVSNAGEGARWFKKLMLRISATLLDLAVIPVATVLGVVLMIVVGAAVLGPEEQIVVTDPQALFLNAFVTVEAVRAFLRFFLSPRSTNLRVVTLPDRGAGSLWRLSSGLTYALGYGQLLVVPLISSGVSVFVGRAAAALFSAVIVAALIVYVLSVRRRVSVWLTAREDDSAAIALARPLLVRWHWPVLAYLLYMLVAVLTRPGNTLIPLLQKTGEIALTVALASIVLAALTARAYQRVSIPGAISDRLPLLEERINQLRPVFLAILRFFVLVITVVILLNLLGLQGIGGFLSGALLQQFSSGLFSVLLIVSLLALVWLAMTSWVDYRLNPFVGSVPTSREVTLLTLLKNAVTVAIIIVGIIMSLAQLGMNVGPLIASAGVIGLAISFGAQRMVEDIFSGIFIQAENAMNVGDVVDVGGTLGTVEKLTVRSVTLRDLAGVVHVIPFSSSAKISNYMRDFAYHVADIGVAYREELDDVRQAMHDAFDRLKADEELSADIIDDLEWFGLNAFGPSELVMRARIKTVPGKQWGIGRAYNAIVKELFDERGIEIPFPHQTLYFGEDKSGRAPPLHMRLDRRSAERESAAHAAPEPKTVPSDDGRIAGTDHPDEDGR